MGGRRGGWGGGLGGGRGEAWGMRELLPAIGGPSIIKDDRETASVNPLARAHIGHILWGVEGGGGLGEGELGLGRRGLGEGGLGRVRVREG